MRSLKCWDAVKWVNQSKHTPSWYETQGPHTKIITTHDSKVGVWRWLCMMNSDLNLAKLFIILIMRHWEGWDAVNCLNQSKITQSWCQKKWISAKPTLTPPAPQKHVVVTIIEHIYQPQSSPTIHYTCNEKLEGLRCCELLGPIQTHTILEWKVDECKANFDPTRTSKTRCGDHYRAHIPITTFSNHSSYS